MLRINDLKVAYGKFVALWGMSLEIRRGELIALLGPNGAGKTTTLNTIIGLLKPLSGSIELNGRRIDQEPITKRVEMGLALVPESRAIFPYMTVEENLLVGAQLRRAWDKRKDTLEWVYQIFPRLKERKNQLAGTMSGGEQQMLNIARALMSRPELIMFDEPSLGLAPKLVLTIFDAVQKIKDEGVTILLTEQHVAHALRMCDRAYIMETGRIVMHGPGKELLEDPKVKEKYLGV